jgi:glutamate/aspartate transport system substrate-binding protein
MKEVDFSNFVFVESTGVLVAKASNFQSFAGMAGKKIAVVSGTTNESAIKDHIRVRKIDVTLISVKDRDEGVAALESGKADGFASDKLLIVGAKMKQPDALTMLPDDLSMEPYAIVLPRGEWAFRLAVNTGLAQIYRSGAIEEAYKQWFGRIGLRPGLLLEAAYALGSLAD